MANMTYAQAVRKVIQEEMRRDDKVFVMGEDVEKLGGVFGTTRDLYKEFGTERIRNTPISESAIVGAAVGAASAGMRPIAELMYWDFAFVAADQIFNQMCKTRYVFGGNAKLPIVLRSQQGTGRGNAATHSQSLETIFMHIPGVKVACPSTPAEAAGLLRTAIRDDNPVCFFEHKALYITKGEVPDDPEFMIPFGKADIKRETLPSPQDLVAMKRAKIKDDLQEIVANESYGDYADIAAELLESYAPDVALGALLRLAFRSELDQSNYPEIRSFSVDRKGKARLFLALGGRDGYTARRIVEMLKRKCGLRDKNIDDVRVFENYSLVSVPFSDAEAVVGQLNASGGRRRIAKIDGSDAENGGGKRRRPATEGRNGGEGASGSESAGEPRSETRGRRKAGQPEGAEEFRSERRPRRETAETADDAGERRPVTRSRKKAENDWNASPAGGNDGFDWEAFQRYDDAAAWEKPKRGGGTRSVRRSGRPVTTGRQAAPKRIAAKGRKR